MSCFPLLNSMALNFIIPFEFKIIYMGGGNIPKRYNSLSRGDSMYNYCTFVPPDSKT